MPAISPLSLVLTAVLSLGRKVGFVDAAAGATVFNELGEGLVVEVRSERLVLSPTDDIEVSVALAVVVEDTSAVLDVTDGVLVL